MTAWRPELQEFFNLLPQRHEDRGDRPRLVV